MQWRRAFIGVISGRAAALSQNALPLFRHRGVCDGVRSCVTMKALAASLVGVGSVAPDQTLTNEDLSTFINTSDEWISQRTGISRRKVLRADEKLSSLATSAGADALAAAAVDPGSVDLVILATSSPDDLFGDATTVATGVGADQAVAFDLTAACSGFLFALVTASQFLETGCYETALVIGADALSRWVNWSDRNTCVLFGDGAGAVVLKRNNATPGILGFALQSDGKDQHKLTLSYAGSSQHLDISTKPDGASVSNGSYAPIEMNGKDVYKFATREVPVVIEAALEKAGLHVDDVDWLLLHQANIRIMEAVADRIGIPSSKILTNLDEYGNTSAASIPLALHHAVKTGKVVPGHIVACAGFGAGLSSGAAIMRWDGAA
mmetsp:Transcript_1291/g.4379  ORF Transcript_1291/g.4379 Transcript_1291/m.4379 type:complete len:379 (+) Transcript_1291:156-1292(+)